MIFNRVRQSSLESLPVRIGNARLSELATQLGIHIWSYANEKCMDIDGSMHIQDARFTIKVASQAAIGDMIDHQELLFFSVIIRDEREQVGVFKSAQPSHVFVEVFSPDVIHMLKPLHHHGLAVHH